MRFRSVPIHWTIALKLLSRSTGLFLLRRLDLPLELQDILLGLERNDYLWFWGQQIILVRPVRCPECNRWVEQRLTLHMHDDDPRREREVVRVEWVD